MSEQNNRYKGVVGTIGFHLLALLAVLYFALSTPLPLPGEEGVEVNLGSSDYGMGRVQEKTPPPPAETPANPPPQQAEPEPEQEEDIITQDTEEAPSIEEEVVADPPPETPKPVIEEISQDDPTPLDEEIIPEEMIEDPDPVQTVNERALYKGKSDTGDEGSNQGETMRPGDQGKPDGDPNADNYEGQGGMGDGIGYDLGGRGAATLFKPVYTSNEVGTVVIKVWVDRSGQVKKAEFELKGSNNSSPALVNEAKKAALKSKFDPDPNAQETQIGYITYTFIRIN